MKKIFVYFTLAIALVFASVSLSAEEGCCAQTENCCTNVVENVEEDVIKKPTRTWYNKIWLRKAARIFRGPAIVAASPLIGGVTTFKTAAVCVFWGSYWGLPFTAFSFPYYTIVAAGGGTLETISFGLYEWDPISMCK